MSSCGQWDKNPQWFPKFLNSLKLYMQNSILSEREVGFDLGRGGACVLFVHMCMCLQRWPKSVLDIFFDFSILILRPGLSLNQTVSPQAPGFS